LFKVANSIFFQFDGWFKWIEHEELSLQRKPCDFSSQKWIWSCVARGITIAVGFVKCVLLIVLHYTSIIPPLELYSAFWWETDHFDLQLTIFDDKPTNHV
jgi:hypothetical protein